MIDQLELQPRLVDVEEWVEKNKVKGYIEKEQWEAANWHTLTHIETHLDIHTPTLTQWPEFIIASAADDNGQQHWQWRATILSQQGQSSIFPFDARNSNTQWYDVRSTSLEFSWILGILLGVSLAAWFCKPSRCTSLMKVEMRQLLLGFTGSVEPGDGKIEFEAQLMWCRWMERHIANLLRDQRLFDIAFGLETATGVMSFLQSWLWLGHDASLGPSGKGCEDSCACNMGNGGVSTCIDGNPGYTSLGLLVHRGWRRNRIWR